MRAAAWTAPAIAVASTSPAFAGSPSGPLFLSVDVENVEDALTEQLASIPPISIGPFEINPADGLPNCVSTGNFSSRINAQVTDASGAGVPGKRVTFVLTGGKFIGADYAISGTGGPSPSLRSTATGHQRRDTQRLHH
ncbi:hypothetical protein [Nocardioides yefusunii]|uniref:hypothetical protein n=1 Tax=Nocardioides yefusunii TaxID=2500546 RepID=UPI000FE3FB03|nr:hypothetical protein [Nocardioides yefusunii]